jgi:NADH-quinone oxidoreductase subunit J
MVLYVFVVSYIGGMESYLAGPTGRAIKVASALFAGALFAELTIALVGTGIDAVSSKGAPFRPGFGTPNTIGREFLTTYLVAFEVASILLLIAAVGAVILARRRAGLDEAHEFSVGDFVRGDVGTTVEAPAETMLEAGGPPQR